MKLAAWPALLAPATLALLSACSADPSAPLDPATVAPTLSRAAAPGAESVPIPGRYIVVFRDDVADVPGLARRLAAAQGSSPHFVYSHAIKGFAAPMSAQAAAALARNPNVAYVEQDQVVTTSTTQSDATWGLDRIDQRTLPLSSTYTYTTTASGVTAYIIDTGIRFGHTEFGGRATSGFDAVDGGTADDCDGHGTHVAGTVGGSTYGVAKGVKLVAVRVLDCSGSGSWSGVIAGIDWVTADHQAGSPAVANMSLGGGAVSSVDEAVQNSIADGVTYTVSAGNGNRGGVAQDACNYSPARVGAAITIGATDQTDRKASWSNYGDCVDFFAPGVGITSSWNTSNTATNTISGTSMAAPHVTGAAALYLADHPGATPQQVRDALYAATTKGIVTSSNTANNHLLYTLFGSTTPTNQAPTADFDASCADLACTFTNTSTDDGSIASSAWTFGDGGTSSATSPSHSYAAAGTYTVTLTVTDDGGLTSATSRSVTVSAPSTGGITLTATGSKSRGVITAVDLAWSGTNAASVDVYRDGARIATVANSGAYTDHPNTRGSLTYQVCEAGTNVCSPVTSATF
ncbi:MAG TPA: S8 family serine peptidase [Gemmatimonadaceae bacterium]|nr:S8 family serine peptidase [Gemmatimonadaceae bacterium]